MLKLTSVNAPKSLNLKIINQIRELIFPYPMLRSESCSLVADPPSPRLIKIVDIKLKFALPPEYDPDLQAELEAWDLASSEALDKIDQP